MSEIRRFNVRTSGRNLSEVRRPGIVGIDVAVPEQGKVKTEKPAPEPKAKPLPKAKGTKPASNDARVKTSRG